MVLPVLLVCALASDFPLRIMAKEQLFKIPIIGGFIRRMGAFPVDRGNSDIGAVKTSIKSLKDGFSLLIFPEGTREKDGKLLPPKSGLFVIAAEAGVDVVPCRILYDTPDGKMHLFCKVRVIYGEPMPAAQFAMEGRRDTKKLRANKQALLDAWEKMGR